MESITNLVESVIKPVTKGEVSTKPVEELSATEAVVAFKVLDFIEKEIEPRKKALRAMLLGWVETHATKTTKTGSQVADLGGFSLTREKRRASEPEAEGLKKLLAEGGLKLEDAFDEVKVLQLNPSKLAFLVETGKLKIDAVEALHAIQWALKVREPKSVKEVLTSAKASTGPEAEDE